MIIQNTSDKLVLELSTEIAPYSVALMDGRVQEGSIMLNRSCTGLLIFLAGAREL